VDQTPVSGNTVEPIVVYMVKRHPLEQRNESPSFRWLQIDNGFKKELSGYIGLFDSQKLSVLVDEGPAGPAWTQLMDGILSGKIETIITHLAPLSSGQRQQLIGVCAYSGARLVTPGDGGRNSYLTLSRI
jgi:hypothetical protein